MEEYKGPKYMVLNMDDLIPSCTKREFEILNLICDRIIRKRESEGKNPTNSYIVVNTDEPYIEEIKDILKKHNHWG